MPSCYGQNPLGKIPTLILEDGRSLYDSAIILEYLDALAGGGKIIPAGEARFATLTRQALADGIMDAALLQVYEQRWREPDKRSANWVAHHGGKVERGLSGFEADPPDRRSKTSTRSRSPRRSAISICASTALGARRIRSWSAGSRRLRPKFPLSRRRAFAADRGRGQKLVVKAGADHRDA